MLCFYQAQSMATPNFLRSLFLALIFSLYYFPIASLSDPGLIGINYGRIANDLPQPSQVVQLLKSQGVTRVKLYDTDQTALSAFSGSGISVTVALPNELLSSSAADQSFTDTWVKSNIVPYTPATQIEAIAVGNEVFVDPKNTTQFLVAAMKNVYSSLVKFNLDKTIKISSPIALSALAVSYPSSAGAFKPELIEPVIKPMLSFLKQTGSYLMVNAYPFFAYTGNTAEISLDYALFRDKQGVVDSGNGLRYYSLFDAQIDAVFAAMNALQYDDVKMVITETGWPSKGDENEAGSSAANAAAYNGNLVRRVLTGGGSPLRPNEPLNVFLFALFNENQKTGPTSERNYGLFYPNEEKVYNIPLTLEDLNTGESTPVNGTRMQVPAPANGGDFSPSATSGRTWCVANGKVAEEKLQEALDYACGEGGADCRPIQEGATCYDPNTLEAHASYAFNSYYQMKARGTGTCDFGGAAYVITQPPQFGSCEFPTGS
ncbi:Glucan endo-1,3-beta-glucosidase [Actinidia chinensis var. chinensis]|uniref:glucan endo-1,3-beta-D-glucosidase n=1 Tax=Actinidia chinensis var. chinensis TaxID=1590841 RepID=A0A2R6P4U5_ACTCC|nr:Glucan endo-1,3-beta-glucosidase [Actinidia chinensis var. chinensis]